MQKNIILSMFEQKLFNLPCWPDINEHAAKEISQWSDLVEPLDWFPPLLCKIIWLYNRKFVKLLGLFLIRCVFTKKILGGQKFVKTGTRKNRGFLEHCELVKSESSASVNCIQKSNLRDRSPQQLDSYPCFSSREREYLVSTGKTSK